ncbi:ribonuclease BN [Streptomyces sp. NPDC006733]|uniref:ribonuclease BN n=1 Tax=Streptomyces sp. NPDC006733 TaxID=3155460 RepID=UPI003409A735
MGSEPTPATRPVHPGPDGGPPVRGPRPVRVARRIWRRGVEIELMQRSMSFAALGLVTLVPLLIVVAAALGHNGQGFVQWIRDALGVRGSSAAAVESLFSSPARVLSTTTALSLASVAVFGLSFIAAIQTAYERIWDLPSAPWHATWRRALALAVLVGYLLTAEYAEHVLEGTPLQPFLRILVTGGGGVAFFWWSQHFLLCGRVGPRLLLPGALLTVAGLVGLRFFSIAVFAPLIAGSAVSYGPIGTVLIVQSWLIGIGFVIYAGALAGQGMYERKRPQGR